MWIGRKQEGYRGWGGLIGEVDSFESRCLARQLDAVEYIYQG